MHNFCFRKSYIMTIFNNLLTKYDRILIMKVNIRPTLF